MATRPLQLIVTALVLLLLLDTVAAKCRFPKEWKGRWYQSGLGDVIIRSKSIQRKGNCIEHHKDYFVMENEDETCFQCLLMMKRHRNIIQYKESFCMPATELRTLCTQIRVEAILYTLVREPTTPIHPPFEEVYRVDYNDGSSGFCPEAKSSAKPCAGQDKVNFHFNHCTGLALWHGADLSFEVLATWKDGSENYMYGKFAGPVIGTKDSSYRCFKYEHYGPDIYMAMSADATCRGIRSPRDGPITMHFMKAPADLASGHPDARCTFPAWLADTTWTDMASKMRYSVDEAGSTLSTMRHWGEELVGDEGSTEELHSQMGCLEVQESAAGSEVIVAGFTTNDCDIEYQCLRFRRIDNNLVALYEGEGMVEFKDVHHCRRQQAHNHEYLILLDLYQMPVPAPCPVRGQYHIPSVSNNCDAHLDMGCRNSSGLDLIYSCLPRADHLKCLSSWREENSTLLITSMDHIGKSVYNCWVLSYHEGQLRMDSESCNRGAITILQHNLHLQRLFKTECDGSSPPVVDGQEPEHIIIDRQQKTDAHPTPTLRPTRPPDRPPVISATDNSADSEQFQSDKSKHDSMYRTSSQVVVTSSVCVVLVCALVGQYFTHSLCCR